MAMSRGGYGATLSIRCDLLIGSTTKTLHQISRKARRWSNSGVGRTILKRRFSDLIDENNSDLGSFADLLRPHYIESDPITLKSEFNILIKSD